MKVFLESGEFGYEEFSAATIGCALLITRNLYAEALALQDNVERRVGIIFKSNRTERKGLVPFSLTDP
jgi:hypothetical protein